ncbi:KEOPS complex subunit [Candidatus Bathyarchaeota archaeon]|nr:KEOPS complex subunit [Candidatus Bathyarchaeota archaeon]
MKIKAEISLMYEDEKKRKAILMAISPDNVETPKNLDVKSFIEKNKVTTLIMYNGENLLTLQSTIDDLLSCISIAEKTISALKTKN